MSGKKHDKSLKMKKISRNGKFFFLALDQGLEHGPDDFDEKTIDPEYIIDLSTKMDITGLILQKGLAIKYSENYMKRVPLILKLNGKTSLAKTEPFAPQITSVKDAVDMRADAVGYTIYVGSERENEMFKIAGEIEEEARDYGLPFIIWSYPRGKSVLKPDSFESIEYAARVALELGADIVKIHYTGSKKSFTEVVRAAGKCKVVSAGGPLEPLDKFYKDSADIMDSGAAGMAVGRNIWQNKSPVYVAKKLASIIFDKER
ncbi:MAG: fructose-bisphosphate aldolase [Candidatus Aenigmarchaeota archaeon]|nr:fructose-bisphosphate aldolase [Candidatus Aenigmarchaeota archaeon]